MAAEVTQGTAASSAGRRLSIVWVSHFIPYPPIGGAFQRSFYLLRHLARRHDVHLVAVRHKQAVHPGMTVQTAREALQGECASVEIIDLSKRTSTPRLLLGAAASLLRREPLTVLLYADRGLREAIRDAVALRQPDVLHLDTIGLAQYEHLADSARTVLGHQNTESAMMKRRVAFERNPLARSFYRLEARKLRQYERKMCARFDANVVVSTLEGDTLCDSASLDAFDIVANGVDVDYLRPVRRRPESKTLIFAGRLDQYANRDGIVHFVRTAWPAIRAVEPAARLLVVGANPPADVQALASPSSGIEVRGFVEDIRPCFEHATAAVIPVRDGGGTRLKVLDALALGMPVVSTTLGIEGLGLEPESDVLVADSPDQFASQVARLLSDPGLQDRLAARARRVVEERFAWDRIAGQLSDVYLRLTSSGRRRTAVRPSLDGVIKDGVLR